MLRDAAVKGERSLLAMFIAGEALHAGQLRTVLDDYKAAPLTLYAIYPSTRHLSVKVRLFIDFWSSGSAWCRGTIGQQLERLRPDHKFASRRTTRNPSLLFK